jgi:hypothetical protein
LPPRMLVAALAFVEACLAACSYSGASPPCQLRPMLRVGWLLDWR